MKSFKFSILFSLIAILTFSCGSDDDNSNSDDDNQEIVGQSGVITAQVNGIDYESDIDTTTATVLDGQLTIAALNPEGELLTIIITDFEGDGPYVLDGFDTAVGLFAPTGSDLGGTTAEGDGGGSITITDFEEGGDTISGNFSFIAIRTLTNNTVFEITDGSFSDLNIIKL